MPTRRLAFPRYATVLLLAAGVTAAACRQNDFSSGPVASSMEIVRQDRPTDTTHGAPAIVVLRIRDAAAEPARGVSVRFDSPITQMNGVNYAALYIGTDTTQPSFQASNLNYANTDDDGLVAVSVSRGAPPGRWAIVVTSADVRNLRDSVVFVTTAAPSATGSARR